MFKLITSFSILAVVAARPAFVTLGTVVKHIPTAITHQSQTQIHSTPITSSIIAPVISSVHETAQILPSPAVSSEILLPSLLQQQGQQILSSGLGSIINEEGLLLNEQSSITGHHDSFIGGDESLLLSGQGGIIGNGDSVDIGDQTALIGQSGLLMDSIDASGLQLNGLQH